MERVRTASEQDRVERILAAHTEARRQMRRAAKAESRRLRLTDLNGRPLSLLDDQIPAFQRRCCQELGLPPGSDWPMIRQQWRRQSLRWHPDHGGSTAEWLRKQRAYDALRLLSERRPWRAPSLPPALVPFRPPGRRWWNPLRGPFRDPS